MPKFDVFEIFKTNVLKGVLYKVKRQVSFYNRDTTKVLLLRWRAAPGPNAYVCLGLRPKRNTRQHNIDGDWNTSCGVGGKTFKIILDIKFLFTSTKKPPPVFHFHSSFCSTGIKKLWQYRKRQGMLTSTWPKRGGFHHHTTNETTPQTFQLHFLPAVEGPNIGAKPFGQLFKHYGFTLRLGLLRPKSRVLSACIQPRPVIHQKFWRWAILTNGRRHGKHDRGTGCRKKTCMWIQTSLAHHSKNKNGKPGVYCQNQRTGKIAYIPDSCQKKYLSSRWPPGKWATMHFAVVRPKTLKSSGIDKLRSDFDASVMPTTYQRKIPTAAYVSHCKIK